MPDNPLNELNGGINAALLAAQLACQPAIKDAENPHFKNQYVSLAAVREAVIPAFHKNGLAVIQDVDDSGGQMMLRTSVVHQSEAKTSFWPIAAMNEKDPQKVASATTYARRYSLLALAGLAPEDDDGAAASTPVKEANLASTAQLDTVHHKSEALKLTQEKLEKAVQWATGGSSSMKGMTYDQAEQLITFLDQKIQEKQS